MILWNRTAVFPQINFWIVQVPIRNNNKNPIMHLEYLRSVARNGVRISPVREGPGKDPNTSSVRISFYHKGGNRTSAARAN